MNKLDMGEDRISQRMRRRLKLIAQDSMRIGRTLQSEAKKTQVESVISEDWIVWKLGTSRPRPRDS